MVVFDDLATEERIRVHDKSVRQPDQLSDDLTLAPMSYRYGDVVAPYVAVNEPLSVEDQHFVDCVVHGQRPRTDGHNGLAVVEVLEAADISLREGRPVRVDEVRDRASAVPEPVTAGGVLPGPVDGFEVVGALASAAPVVVPAQRTAAMGSAL
jgi:hypothetical protein